MKQMTWRWLELRPPLIKGWKTTVDGILEKETLKYNIMNQEVQLKRRWNKWVDLKEEMN